MPTGDFEERQRELLEWMARGRPMSEVLDGIVRLIERQADGLLCSILLVDAESRRVRHASSPSLPEEYSRVLDGAPIGPREGSCGAAAHLGERVVVEDISVHPNWESYRHHALRFGLRACWSTPIFSSEREVLGTFAIYYREIRGPKPVELEWVDRATHLASIAITRERSEDERRRLVKALQQSENRLRALVEHTPDVAIQWYDADGRVVFCNRTSERLFGWAPGIALGKTLFELGFLDAFEESRFAAARRAAARGEKVEPIEFRYRRADGATGALLSTVFEIPFDATQACYVCMDIELTARRQMEEAIRAAEALRAQIYTLVDDVIFYLSVEGEGRYRFVSVNRAFLDATGLGEAQVVGKLVGEVIPEPSLTIAMSKYAEALRTRRRVTWDEMTSPPSGPKYGEASVSPVFDPSGAATNLVGTVHDVTARRRAEEERRRLEAQLQQGQRLQSLGTLAAGIAHDFNNLLAIMHANADVALLEIENPASSRESLETIQQACRQGAELVRRMLTFSREHRPRRETLDLRRTVDEALDLVRVTLPARVELRRRYQSVPLVGADPVQVHQVVLNLTTNAAHALGDRQGSIEVGLMTRSFDTDSPRPSPDLHAGDYACLTVRDDGCGMDADTMLRIFDPFFTTKAHGAGTGLGLSTVHGIVKAHDGAITVESTPDVGTTFSIFLPAAAAPLATVAPTEPLPKGARVLYVDDEEALVFLAKRALERLGHEVTGYTDPTLALRDFRARPDEFDVVVTDLSMPSLSGTELAQAVLAARADVAVILVTGFVKNDDLDAATRLGIRHVIPKPLSVDELARTLAPLLPARSR